MVYLALHRAHAGTLPGHGLVGEPQGRGYVLDETDGVSVLDVRRAHAIHVLLGAWVELLLR